MDWKTWAAVGLSIIGLFLWQFYYASNLTPPPPVAEAVPSATPDAATSSTTTSPAPALDSIPAAKPEATPVEPVMAARSEAIVARDAEYIFNNDTGGIEEVRLLQHFGENKEVIYLNRDRKMPIGAIGLEPGQPATGFNMEVNRTKGEVVFHKHYPDGLFVRKIFTLPSEDSNASQFTVGLRLEFSNTGESEVQRLGYFVSAGGAAPVHVTDLPIYTRFDWHRENKMQSIDVNWFSPSSIPLIGIQTRGAREFYAESRDKIDWVAVASQYFCTIVTSPESRGLSVWARRFDTRKQNDAPVYGIQGAMGLPGFRLAPGEKATEVLEIYAGPKDFSILQKMAQGQSAVMNFGMFGIVSEILLWAMNSLYGLVGNYAAAIIILTLIIKSILWPIQNKSTESMRKMALLSPKMTELREKYKDNPQKMNEELMKLYKDYGINPFSGCLPLIIQIPIFFGFYSMLGVAIELRNASFFWIHDLSQPDTVGYILGFPVNLLPIIMAITMIWQIAITPKTGDKMQTRIFYIMPVVFLAFCYNFASALALYWTTQNIFSIVQLYLTRNRPLPTLEKKSVVAKREAIAAKKAKKKGRPKP
jgi:YidC/Oxa1 family membrane protein insertase